MLHMLLVFKSNVKGLELIIQPCIGGYSLTEQSPGSRYCTCAANSVAEILQCENDEDTIITEV